MVFLLKYIFIVKKNYKFNFLLIYLHRFRNEGRLGWWPHYKKRPGVLYKDLGLLE